MNNNIKNTIAAGIFAAALILGLAALVHLNDQAKAADVNAPLSGEPFKIVDTKLTWQTNIVVGTSTNTYETGGNTNCNITTATNGFYPASISIAGTVTNPIAVSVKGGKDFAYQFTGAVVGTNGGDTYTATLIWKSSVAPPSMIIDTGNGSWTNKNPSVWWVANTVAFPGKADAVAVANPVTTNFNFTSGTASTGVKGAIPYLYLNSIGIAGGVLTNYSVWVNSQ